MIPNISGWSRLEGRGDRGRRGCKVPVTPLGGCLSTEVGWGQGGAYCDSYLSVAAYQQVWDGTRVHRCQSYLSVAAYQQLWDGCRSTGCQSYLSVAAYQQVWDGTAAGWHRRRQRARQPRQGACGTVSSAAAPQCLMLAAAPSC